MTETTRSKAPSPSLRAMLIPLALAQFICSFAGSNMNVMINDISIDLHTTVQGVQVCITLFLLVMAALMIPCGKLTDRLGRKRCFTARSDRLRRRRGAAARSSPGLGVLILGNSIFEGVGTALLIPPVYILTTMLFTDLKSRAWAFGVISALGGIGAAMGPLIGGVITTTITWRAAFIFQALVIVVILVMARRLVDPVPPDPTRPFDVVGAVLSAAGLVILVGGIMAADQSLALMAGLIVLGALVLGRLLLMDPAARARRPRGPALDFAVPQPHIQPGSGDSEHAVVGLARYVLHRRRVSPGRPALRRHPNRSDLHCGHGRESC